MFEFRVRRLEDIRQDIDKALEEPENVLKEARQYIGYFQTVYTLSIALMVLLVLGIIVILRDVKSITRLLGIPLLVYGALEYAGIWVARYFSRGQINIPQISPGTEDYIYQLINNTLRPLEIFSLVLLVTGVILTVVSFVYKRDESL